VALRFKPESFGMLTGSRNSIRVYQANMREIAIRSFGIPYAQKRAVTHMITVLGWSTDYQVTMIGKPG
jgi:hypothetical protein